jgi:hypothetical protein
LAGCAPKVERLILKVSTTTADVSASGIKAKRFYLSYYAIADADPRQEQEALVGSP